jgi:hypothetical protein
VFPHPSQTKHDPAILIFTPHVIHSGASDFDPLIFSKSSIEEPTPAVEAGAFSIFTSCTFFAGALTGAATACGFSSSVYVPLSSARARSAAE